MKIEIDCPDINTAFALTQIAPPEGIQIEPLPPVLLSNETPIQATEPTISFVTVMLNLGIAVSAGVAARFIYEAIHKACKGESKNPPPMQINIRIDGAPVNCGEREISVKIIESRKRKSK